MNSSTTSSNQAATPAQDGRKRPVEPVYVIGGGLAGCSAALALARTGTRVVLLESKSRLGGRVGSYTDPVTGDSIDYCQHVGMGCCTSLKTLIQWLQAESDWHTQRALYFYGPGTRRRTLSALPLPAPAHLAGWLISWPGLNWIERIGIARAMRSIDRIDLDAWRQQSTPTDTLDDCSAYEWLIQHGQSKNCIDKFWSTIIVSALGEQLDRVGLRPVAKVFQDGFLRSRDAYHLLIPKLPLHELLGSRMHQALAAAGVDIRFNHAVQELQFENDQCCRIVCNRETFSIDGNPLIMAAPWHALGSMFTAQTPMAIKQIIEGASSLGGSPISGVHTWWDRAWLPTSHAVLVGQLCQWVFPKPNQLESNQLEPFNTASSKDGRSASESYYQIVISASRQLPRGDTEVVKRLIEADLRQVFPEARSAILTRLKVVTDPVAVFSVAPGSESRRPVAGCQTGNIIWAGDWVRTGWPATMESAILSGFQAAQAIGPMP